MAVAFVSMTRLGSAPKQQIVQSVAAVGIFVAERDVMHHTLKRSMMENPSDGQTASTPLLQSVRALVIA